MKGLHLLSCFCISGRLLQLDSLHHKCAYGDEAARSLWHRRAGGVGGRWVLRLDSP